LKYLKLGFVLLLFFLGRTLVHSNVKPESNKNIKVSGLVMDSIIASTNRDSIVNFAIQYLGAPYVYGASNKNGFDCSGFVYFVFKHFNLAVPRSSSEYKDFGKTISIDEVEKGDILIFLSPTRHNAIGHIGIVTTPKGMETEFIHATSGKEMKVLYSTLKDPGYGRRFIKAINVI